MQFASAILELQFFLVQFLNRIYTTSKEIKSKDELIVFADESLAPLIYFYSILSSLFTSLCWKEEKLE